MVNQLKLKLKLNFPTTLTLSTFQPHYATFLTKNKKEKLPTHGSYKKKTTNSSNKKNKNKKLTHKRLTLITLLGIFCN